MIKLPLFVLSWVLFLVLRTMAILLGWVLIPPMALLNKYTTVPEESKINGRTILNWKYKFMYPWSNDEDGVVAGEEFLGYPTWFRMIYWSAVRNPANNLRFIPLFNCKIDPSKVEFIKSDILNSEGYDVTFNASLYHYDYDDFRFTTLTWCGLYSNLRVQFKMFGKIWRFWIGWKIYPHDKDGIADWDYRKHGAGFATQFKRIYPR